MGSAGAPAPALEAAIAKGGGRILHVHAGFGIALVSGLSAKAAGELRTMGAVRAVVPDLTITLRPTKVGLRRLSAFPHRGFGVKGDPRGATAVAVQWNMHVTKADSAWQVTNQGKGMHVYVLDTGVDTANEELTGKIDTKNSISFAYAPTDTLMLNPLPFGHDVVGHGTFVSSIITTNSVKIAGTAPQAMITMVRELDDSGSGDLFGLLNGMLYAADQNADVANISSGGYLSRTDATNLAIADLIEGVVQYGAARGVQYVAAAGNEGVNFNTATSNTNGNYADSLEYPGGIAGILSIGATGPLTHGSFDDIASYSNFGSLGVGVFAPGGNEFDTTSAALDSELVIGACSSATPAPLCPGQEDQLLIGAGTSFSAPLVTGEIAVIKANAAAPLSPATLKKCVLNNADNVTGKRPDPAYNFGRVNVLASATASGCK